MKTTFAEFLLFVAALFTSLARAQTPTATTGNVENGKNLFKADGCYQCHGRQAQGGAAGPRLGPPRIPVEAVKVYVRHPAGAMPPYTTKVLSDAQIVDIYAFLETIPAPPPVNRIPLLNQ
jgi:ubiquinol-cytochrome c reductase cytochrome c subunit